MFEPVTAQAPVTRSGKRRSAQRSHAGAWAEECVAALNEMQAGPVQHRDVSTAPSLGQRLCLDRIRQAVAD
eukprot:1783800-Heterocapsa_arctica.AAC.1